MAGSVYTIDFTTPTLPGKNSFQIPPGGFDGPELEATDPNKCHTSLHLFGQGFLRYGEKANENFLRLLENFAGDIEPLKPTIGQVWFDTTTNTLKVFDVNQSWIAAGGILPPQSFTIVDASVVPPKFFIQGNVTSILSLGSTFIVTSGPNIGTYTIDTNLGSVYYNGGTDLTEVTVTTPPLVATGGGTIQYTPQPTGPTIGQLWFDVVDNFLKVWNGSVWQVMFMGDGNVNGDATDLNMRGYKILNLATPSSGDDATTKTYVDTAVATVSSSVTPAITDLQNNKVNKAGDTMTGSLTLSGDGSYLFCKNSSGTTILTIGGSGSVTQTSDIIADAHLLMSAEVSVYIHVDAGNTGTGHLIIAKGSAVRDGTQTSLFTFFNNGELRSNTVNYETLVNNDNTIPNKKYVDEAISGAIGGAGTTIPAINPTSPKDGDIRVVGSVISIRAAGAWRQIFPAVYA